MEAAYPPARPSASTQRGTQRRKEEPPPTLEQEVFASLARRSQAERS